jgi:hypothetical protein
MTLWDIIHLSRFKREMLVVPDKSDEPSTLSSNVAVGKGLKFCFAG